MKKIYFIRHAKAVEESEGGDFERDLSERGKKDLALMCERLKKHEVRADAISRQTLCQNGSKAGRSGQI